MHVFHSLNHLSFFYHFFFYIHTYIKNYASNSFMNHFVSIRNRQNFSLNLMQLVLNRKRGMKERINNMLAFARTSKQDFSLQDKNL